MDSYHLISSPRDSPLPRSRANSQRSVGESALQALHITEKLGPRLTVPGDTTSSESLQSSSTSATSESQHSPAFLDCPPPRHFYHLSAQSTLLENWQDFDSAEPSTIPVSHAPPSEAPLLLLEQPLDQVEQSNLAARLDSLSSAFDEAAMSTLALQYDSRFDAGTRASFSWPGYDMNEPFIPSDLLPLDAFHEPSFIPVYSRSLSSSPPQVTSFTSEQREIKRQRERARKEAKARIRIDRSRSEHSYNPSQAVTPDLLPRSSPSYSSTMVSTPILADNTIPTSMPAPMPTSITTSMPLPMGQTYFSPTPLSSSASPELYGTGFPLGSNDFTGGFFMPYASPVPEVRLPTYRPRPQSMPSAHDMPFLYQNTISSMPLESPDTVRVVHSRPKPQCWDHGCNGRQFSTFSNLLRHQREKSGAASKPTCPKCGAEFTRTTARNGHMAHEKCKQRRNS